MPRLHMQVWQRSTERKACIKVFLCGQGHAIFSLGRVQTAYLELQVWNLSFKTWKSVFTNVGFRSWSSKPLSVNAVWVSRVCSKNIPFHQRWVGGRYSPPHFFHRRLSGHRLWISHEVLTISIRNSKSWFQFDKLLKIFSLKKDLKKSDQKLFLRWNSNAF